MTESENLTNETTFFFCMTPDRRWRRSFFSRREERPCLCVQSTLDVVPLRVAFISLPFLSPSSSRPPTGRRRVPPLAAFRSSFDALLVGDCRRVLPPASRRRRRRRREAPDARLLLRALPSASPRTGSATLEDPSVASGQLGLEARLRRRGFRRDRRANPRRAQRPPPPSPACCCASAAPAGSRSRARARRSPAPAAFSPRRASPAGTGPARRGGRSPRARARCALPALQPEVLPLQALRLIRGGGERRARAPQFLTQRRSLRTRRVQLAAEVRHRGGHRATELVLGGRARRPPPHWAAGGRRRAPPRPPVFCRRLGRRAEPAPDPGFLERRACFSQPEDPRVVTATARSPRRGRGVPFRETFGAAGPIAPRRRRARRFARDSVRLLRRVLHEVRGALYAVDHGVAQRQRGAAYQVTRLGAGRHERVQRRLPRAGGGAHKPCFRRETLRTPRRAVRVRHVRQPEPADHAVHHARDAPVVPLLLVRGGEREERGDRDAFEASEKKKTRIVRRASRVARTTRDGA